MLDASDPGRHTTCPQCRLAAGFCQLDASNPCSVCKALPIKTWKKLRRSLCDTEARAVQRGKKNRTSAFPHFEAWIANRPASTAASSEPCSAISSLVDIGDDFSENNVIISTTGVVGDLEVHESIGVTTVMADTAMPTPIRLHKPITDWLETLPHSSDGLNM